LPPGVTPDDEAMNRVFEESTADVDQDDLASFSEQQANHHPHGSCWYLPMIGVDPMRQGKGYGSLLLDHALAICDRESLPAYLESTSPRSRALYERHGFEAIGEIQAGKSPPMWPMLRKPR
jgi:GNAT superfamily N-acetyltransferase